MKYSKVFDTHSDYESFVQSGDFMTPNISCCKQWLDIHYNKWTEKKYITVECYSVGSGGYNIYGNNMDQYVNSLTLDGEEISINNSYTFTGDQLGQDHVFEIELNDNTTIPAHFFSDSDPNKITIHEGFTTIGNYVFSDSFIEEVDLPNSVVTFGTHVFDNCSDLVTVHLPEGLTTIPEYTFYFCRRLKNINIPIGITSIGDYSFSYCFSNDTTVPITYEFNNIQTIGSNAFSGSPDSATSTKALHLILGSNLTTVGPNTFYMSGSRWKSITVKATTPPTVSPSGSLFQGANSSFRLYVPAESVTAYQSATGWSAVSSYTEAIPTT